MTLTQLTYEEIQHSTHWAWISTTEPWAIFAPYTPDGSSQVDLTRMVCYDTRYPNHSPLPVARL